VCRACIVGAKVTGSAGAWYFLCSMAYYCPGAAPSCSILIRRSNKNRSGPNFGPTYRSRRSKSAQTDRFTKKLDLAICRISAKLVGADMPPGLMIEYRLLKYSDGQEFSSSVLIKIYVQNPTHPCMHCYERKPKVLVWHI
jgi:hypothetical protein